MCLRGYKALPHTRSITADEGVFRKHMDGLGSMLAYPDILSKDWEQFNEVLEEQANTQPLDLSHSTIGPAWVAVSEFDDPRERPSNQRTQSSCHPIPLPRTKTFPTLSHAYDHLAVVNGKL